MKKRQTSKQSGQSNGTFLTTTLAAVTAAVIMMALGWPSSHPQEVTGLSPPTTTGPPISTSQASPPSVSTMTTSPAPTTTTPPPPIPTASPSPIISIPSIDEAMSKGSPNAPVTIIVYSDFQCTHCQRFALTVEKELEAAYIDTGRVRLVYKFIVGWADESLRADEAAACAAEQGQFWPYYFLLMEQHTSPTVDDLPVEKLQDLAQQLGLDMNKFNASLLSGKYEALVNQQHEEGIALGVTGTPTFFINGVKKLGAGSLEVLQDVIDPMLQKGGQ